MCEQIISLTRRIARKAHACDACNDPIPKGVAYLVSFERQGGHGVSLKWHRECRAEFDRALSDGYDDCMDPWETWENRRMPQYMRATYGFKPGDGGKAE